MAASRGAKSANVCDKTRIRQVILWSTKITIAHGWRKLAGSLFQEILKTLGVKHANAQIFQFARRPASQTFFRPAWQCTEALLDLPSKHCQFASLVLASEHLVIQN